jgi:SAM-dependent methyltransferase
METGRATGSRSGHAVGTSVGSCVLCGDDGVRAFAALPRVPLNCSATPESREAALVVPRGDIVLGHCPSCGMIRNVDFDPERLAYDLDYENSLHHSPSFQRFAEELADYLVDGLGVREKHVVEVGSGKGEFLRLLCERGGNRGVGFDPSYAGPDEPGVGGGVRFVSDLYSDRYADEPADLVCCRHVLEHLDDPRALVAGLRRTLGERKNALLYFEVPDADCVLGGDGSWDIIYPHCSYFAAPPLRRLFEEEGFLVRRVHRVFGEQFLALEAVPGEPRRARPDPDALAKLEARVLDFSARFGSRIAHWSEHLARAAERGDRVALWGAGAKGVTFLNVADPEGCVEAVVDLNPRKQGTHVPGTGQQITAPESLAGDPPRTVLIMNPMYRDEIVARLAELNVPADVQLV